MANPISRRRKPRRPERAGQLGGLAPDGPSEPFRERERERESNAKRLTGNPNHHVPTPTSSDGIERKSTNIGASNGELCFETNKSVSLDRWVKMNPEQKEPLKITCGCGTTFLGELDTICPGCNQFAAATVTYPASRGGMNPPTADSRQPTADNNSLLADSPNSEFVRRQRERGNDRQVGDGWDHFQRGAEGDARWWETEPGMGRVVDGLAYRVDRLRLTGNGVVPQQAAVAWKRIKEISGEYEALTNAPAHSTLPSEPSKGD